MKVKALVSFVGKVTMAASEVREIKDEVIVKDLLRAGYVEVVEETDVKDKVVKEKIEKPKKSKKKVITDENQ